MNRGEHCYFFYTYEDGIAKYSLKIEKKNKTLSIKEIKNGENPYNMHKKVLQSHTVLSLFRWG